MHEVLPVGSSSGGVDCINLFDHCSGTYRAKGVWLFSGHVDCPAAQLGLPSKLVPSRTKVPFVGPVCFSSYHAGGEISCLRVPFHIKHTLYVKQKNALSFAFLASNLGNGGTRLDSSLLVSRSSVDAPAEPKFLKNEAHP